MEHVRFDRPRAESKGAAARLAHRLPWYLIAASPVLFALATWDPVGRAGIQDSLRFFSVPVVAIELVAVAAAMVLGFEPIRTIRSSPAWMRTALGALVAIAFSTALFVAPDRSTAILRTCTSVVHLLFGLSLWHLMAARWSGLRRAIWPSIVAGTCGYLVLLVCFVAAVRDPTTFDWGHFRLGVVNIRQVGFYSAIGAAAAIGLAATRGGRAGYLIWVAAAAALLALSFWSGTRSSLVAVVASFGLAALSLPVMRRARALWALMIGLVGGAILSLVHTPPSDLFGLMRMLFSSGRGDIDALSSGRIVTWIGTVDTILERPIFGFGESQFRIVVPESLGVYNHPHNIVLQILLQWGVAGAICFFSLGAAIWWRFHRAARSTGGDAVPAFLVANSLLVFALYEGTLYHPYPIAMLAVAAAFVLSSERGAAAVLGRTQPPVRQLSKFPPYSPVSAVIDETGEARTQ